MLTAVDRPRERRAVIASARGVGRRVEIVASGGRLGARLPTDALDLPQLDAIARDVLVALGHDPGDVSDSDCRAQLAALIECGTLALVQRELSFRPLDGWPEDDEPTIDPRRTPEHPDRPRDDDEAEVDFIVVDDRGEPCHEGQWRLVTDFGEVGRGVTDREGGARRSVLPERKRAHVEVTALRWWGARPADDPSRPRGTVIARVEDVCFNYNSIVVLPNDEAGIVGGLDVARGVLEFLATAPDHHVLVAGHTDGAGSSDGNLELSRARAEAVAQLLKGERDAWASAAAGWSYKVDWRRILSWVARELGWGCDPGPIDEQPRAQADAALRRFRERWELEGGAPITGTSIGEADWRAFFELYDRWLARALGCDAAELAARRSKISWVDPSTVGCGEHWPRMTTEHDDDAIAANRRVDVWLFEPGDVPTLGGTPPGIELYGEDSEFDPWPLPPPSTGPATARQLRVVDRDDRPIADARVHVLQSAIDLGVVTTDVDGYVPLHPPSPVLPVSVSVEGYLLLPVYGGGGERSALGFDEDDEEVATPLVDWLLEIVHLAATATQIKVMAFEEPSGGDDSGDDDGPTPDPDSPFGPENPYRIDDLWDYWRHATTGAHVPLTDDERTLKLASYRAHIRHAATDRRGVIVREFVHNVPRTELAEIPGGSGRLRHAAATAAGELLTAIRDALAQAKAADDDGAKKIRSIGMCSAYRSADEQFGLWNKRWYKYLWQYKKSLGDEHKPAREIAASALARYIGGRTAAPGYSNHNDARAMDLELRMTNGKRLGAGGRRKWRDTWAHAWLIAHAGEHGFTPYEPEPWHWEHPG